MVHSRASGLSLVDASRTRQYRVGYLPGLRQVVRCAGFDGITVQYEGLHKEA